MSQGMTKMLIICAVVLLAGCDDDQHYLTEREKFEMSKKCIEAGMYPDIWRTNVRCMAVPDKEVER